VIYAPAPQAGAAKGNGARRTTVSELRPLLIVEDDLMQRESLLEALAADGEFAPRGAATIAEARELLLAEGARWDAVLLDVGMPDGEGWDLCTWMRKAKMEMPIIMLTGLTDEVDVIRGLNAGASDWVSKPFSIAVLAARLRAQLRLFEETEHAAFAVGHYTFLPAKKILVETARSRKVWLTDKETRIVKRLLRAGPEGVKRQDLLNDVWGYCSGVATHTLETHIYRLRQKMELNPDSPSLIVTIGGGYALRPQRQKNAVETLVAA
jgi:DNA-binding response OmpR family regulator